MAEYIERKTAIAVACKGCNKEFPNEPCEPYECHIQQGLFNIPAADVVEVVHAHWEDGCAIHNGKEVYKSIDCSNCEEIFKIDSYDQEYWKERFKYCPFCGAVMDGGNEE